MQQCDLMIWKQVHAIRVGQKSAALPDVDKDDVYQQCALAVMRAFEKWDRRALFTTYAWPWIGGAVSAWLRDRKKNQVTPAWEEDSDSSDAYSNDDPVAWQKLMDTFKGVPDSQMVLLDAAGYSDREIAALVTGDPNTNIRMRKSRAKGKLKATLVEEGRYKGC